MTVNRNIVLLFLAQIAGFSVLSSSVLIAPLIGADLSGTQRLATLPVGLTIVGTALGVVPITLLMRRFGRRAVFLLVAGIGCSGCMLAIEALRLGSFSVFCGAAICLGVFAAGVQQFRFAAMESVSAEHMASAASTIIFGGIMAAWLGPELAIRGRHVLSIEYTGSYLLLGGCALACAVFLGLYRNTSLTVTSHAQAPRPLRELASSPLLWLAICSAAVGYAVMSGVMTPTSVSMHLLHGHSQADAKWVIQSHIAAMFLPSLFAPVLTGLLGVRGLIATGLVALSSTVIIGLHNTEVSGYWAALVLLGIGWNFTFTGGTTLLGQVARAGEHFRVQALNEGLVFSMQAVASFASGWLLAWRGWDGVMLACMPLLGLLAFMLLVESWSRFRSRTAAV